VSRWCDDYGLVKVANRNGDFRPAMPDRGEATSLVAEHIHKSWQSSMRRPRLTHSIAAQGACSLPMSAAGPTPDWGRTVRASGSPTGNWAAMIGAAVARVAAILCGTQRP